MEVANIYTIPDIDRIFIESRSKLYLQKLREKAEEICRYSISQSYISYSIDSFKNGILYAAKGNYLGFCLWTIHQSPAKMAGNFPDVKHLHILLICAEKNDYHLGTIILQDVEEYAHLHGITQISLESLSDRVGFYERYGFYRESPMSQKMYKAVSTYRFPKTPKTLKHRPSKQHTTRKVRNSTYKLSNMSFLSTNIPLKEYNIWNHENI